MYVICLMHQCGVSDIEILHLKYRRRIQK